MFENADTTRAAPVVNCLRAFLYEVCALEFVGQPWKFKSTFVKEWIHINSVADHGLPRGYYLLVKFDHISDPQIIMDSSRKTRCGYVRVSKRLFDAKPVTIDVFCQYSRIHDNKDSVRLKIAR